MCIGDGGGQKGPPPRTELSTGAEGSGSCQQLYRAADNTEPAVASIGHAIFDTYMFIV